MRESDAPVQNVMLAALENEAGLHSKDASVPRRSSRLHDSSSRPQVEEARAHERETGLHGNSPAMHGAVVRVLGDHAFLQTDKAHG